MRYLVQFPAGLGPLIRPGLRRGLARFREVYADDSALIVDTTTRLRHADQIATAKNVFAVWAEVPRPGRVDGRALGHAVTRLADGVPAAIRPDRPDRNGFRTMIQIDGTLTPVDRGVRARLETALSQRTGQRVQTRGGNTEYWVLGRSDLDQLLLVQRLPRQTPRAKTRAGSLAPELAAALVQASDPAPDDVVCDPFAGSGALLLARSELPVRQLVYVDRELERLRSELDPGLRTHRVRLLADDALTLSSLTEASVDAVVTDPPWGEYEPLDRPFAEFAAALTTSLVRVLTDGGRLVVLVNRANAATLIDALTDGAFTVAAPVEILVNGHPASVVTAIRRPRTMVTDR